jgi:putative redox protein
MTEGVPHLLKLGASSPREANMHHVQVTYEGNQRCTALDAKNGRHIEVDCPITKGAEFGPDSLVAAGLGSCMLISMAGFAERHGLDVAGTTVDVDVSLGGAPETRISAIEVTLRVPRSFSPEEQVGLEKAANACPIKHSFRPETEIRTQFEFAA